MPLKQVKREKAPQNLYRVTNGRLDAELPYPSGTEEGKRERGARERARGRAKAQTGDTRGEPHKEAACSRARMR